MNNLRIKLIRPLIVVLAILGICSIFPWFPAGLPKIILASLYLLLVPGYLSLRLIMPKTWKAHPMEQVGYAVGLSIIYSMLVGLATNVALPLIGFNRPLSAGSLSLVIFDTSLLLLIALKFGTKKLFAEVKPSTTSSKQYALMAAASVLPLLAAGGAISLNNGGTSILSLLSLAAVAIVTLITIWPKKELSDSTYAYILFCSSLSLLLATSLRGNYITGHDIIQEFQVFGLTTSHEFWSMSYLRDAYNACLSITILPTILQKLTGLADAYVFKLLYQFVFALMPAMLYLLLARFAQRRIAFLAAFLFISFPTFMTDMPMLGRQELAFLAFVLFFTALFEPKLSGVRKAILLILFGSGIILSHYSTSYVALGVIVLAKLLESAHSVYRALRRLPRPDKARWMPLGWASISCLLIILFSWNVLITKTGSGISRTIRNVVVSVPKLGSSHTKVGESSYSVVGQKATADDNFQAFIKNSTAKREFAAGQYYEPSIVSKYPAVMKSDQIQTPTRLGRYFGRFGYSLKSFYDNLRNDYALIIQLLIFVGLLAMLIYPRLSKAPNQYQYFGIVSLGAIILQVVLPSSAIDYGLLRLIQQSLVFLALPIIIACIVFLGWLRIPIAVRPRIIMSGLIFFFVILSGLAPALTGGYKPNLVTSNSGFYYEAYYTHKDELAGYGWLIENAPKGAVVYADEFARRKMITYAGIYARGSLLPEVIAKDSFVYLSDSNNRFDNVGVYASGELLFYKPPIAFLQDNKELVYSSGSVKIFK